MFNGHLPNNGIKHNSFNGKPQASANYKKIVAFGLPLNEKNYTFGLPLNAVKRQELYLGAHRSLLKEILCPLRKSC